MRFDPVLAMNLNPNKLDKHAEDDDWYFEQKLDGVRLVIVVDDGNVEGWNRRGNQVSLDPTIVNVLSALTGHFVFDGEWIDNTFWCFDLPESGMGGKGQISITDTYEARRGVLDAIGRVIEEQTKQVFRVLPSARTPEAKRELVAETRANNSEGVMVKNRTGPYWPGKRSRHVLKAKYVETADVIVTEVGRQGKRSVAIALFETEGSTTLVDVGACTITDRILGIVKVGDVIECKYLYATADHKLYQPSFLKIRDDRLPSSCTLDQLKYGNKQVLAAT